jgi:hypothetical protein
MQRATNRCTCIFIKCSAYRTGRSGISLYSLSFAWRAFTCLCYVYQSRSEHRLQIILTSHTSSLSISASIGHLTPQPSHIKHLTHTQDNMAKNDKSTSNPHANIWHMFKIILLYHLVSQLSNWTDSVKLKFCVTTLSPSVVTNWLYHTFRRVCEAGNVSAGHFPKVISVLLSYSSRDSK